LETGKKLGVDWDMVNIFGEFPTGVFPITWAFPMTWAFKLKHIDEAGILRSTVVGLIGRPELTCEADLGLTHDDGKYLIRQVQSRNRPRPSSSDDCKGATMRLLRPASCDQRSSAPADFVADKDSGIIRDVEVTPANEADVTIAPSIIPDEPGEVYRSWLKRRS
jgi:hypothetical protein